MNGPCGNLQKTMAKLKEHVSCWITRVVGQLFRHFKILSIKNAASNNILIIKFNIPISS